jgi:hypothetical protein
MPLDLPLRYRCGRMRGVAIFERTAIGPPPNAPGPPSIGIFARRASKMLGWWVRGHSRPTPFFDDRAKAPCAVPRVLTPSERRSLTRLVTRRQLLRTAVRAVAQSAGEVR